MKAVGSGALAGDRGGGSSFMKAVGSVWLMLATGCGGAVTLGEGDAARDAGPLRDARRETGRLADEGSTVADAGSVADNYVVYREEACPSVVVEPPSLECDPLATASTCAPGEACYPIPPRASDECHPGSYATRCFRAGSGTQGDSCTGGDDCAGGFICVKSSVGDRCVRLCELGKYDNCDPGRMCLEVDVTGANLGGCQ